MNVPAGKVAPGFGIGALEELDDEDEDVYASGQYFKSALTIVLSMSYRVYAMFTYPGPYWQAQHVKLSIGPRLGQVNY